MSNESGAQEIYVTPFPGPGGTRQISNGGGQPRWRSDGKELYFLTPNRIMAATVNGDGAVFAVHAVQPLVEVRPRVGQRNSYDVTADGQKFIVNALLQQANEPLTLVVNWPAALNE